MQVEAFANTAFSQKIFIFISADMLIQLDNASII